MIRETAVTSRPRRILDLFCGAGYGYYLVGCHVTGVDIEQQPRYPLTSHHADALGNVRGISTSPAAARPSQRQNTGASEPPVSSPVRRSRGQLCRAPG